MRAGGGKSKGSSFERECCKELSLWISSGKEEDAFWRSSMSGGRSTVALKSGKSLGAHAGDISATSEIGHKLTNKFLLECKAYADLQMENIFYNDAKGNYLKFWNKLVVDSATFNKYPMLITKQNRCETLIAVNHDGYDLFNLDEIRNVHVHSADMFICSFDDFLTKIDPKILF